MNFEEVNKIQDNGQKNLTKENKHQKYNGNLNVEIS